MIKRSLALLAVVAVAASLAACGEKVQSLDRGVTVDAQAFQGTGLPYAVPGWKQGDKGSWEQQVKTRTQQTQNEYTKVQ